jgi:hypothetical protein
MKKPIALGSFVLMASLLLSARVSQAAGNSRTPRWPASVRHWNASPQSGQRPPQWKSREEYDAFNAVTTENDPNKKISLAEVFIQRYSNSDFKDFAYVAEMRAYAELNQIDKAVNAARKALEVNPHNVLAQGYLRGVSGGITAPPAVSPQDAEQEPTQQPVHELVGPHPERAAQTENRSKSELSNSVREYQLQHQHLGGHLELHPVRILITRSSFSFEPGDHKCSFKAFTVPIETLTSVELEQSRIDNREWYLKTRLRDPGGKNIRTLRFAPFEAHVEYPESAGYLAVVISPPSAYSDLSEIKGVLDRAIAERPQGLREEAERRALPAGLETSVQFDDSQSFLPDNRLDAGKRAELAVTIQNRGPGAGYGVVLALSADKPQVTFPGPKDLGEIAPGQSRTVRVPIEAGLDLPSGELNVFVEAREKRGYDAHKVGLVVTAAALERPRLSIASWVINDGVSGRAHGNGNLIPESGETIELEVFVKNTGPGVAVAPKLAFSHINSGIELLQSSETLGPILPGHTAEGKLVFAIPRTYAGEGLNLTLQAVDGRGPAVAIADRAITLPFSARAPTIVPTARVLLAGQEVKELANGDTAELEVRLDNAGKMDAEDVALHVSAAGAVLQRDQVSMGALPAGEKGPQQLFKFSVPRPFEGSLLPVVITVTQKDYPPTSSRQNIPIRRQRPELAAVRFGIGSEGAQDIRQNASGDLELQIINSGNLVAENVQAHIEIAAPGVEIEGPKVVSIGGLPPKELRSARFRLRVRGGAPAGDLPIQVMISQADFPARTETHHLKITPEQPTQVRVTPVAVTREVPNQPQKPLISVAAPHSGDFVRGATVTLTGSVADQKGIKLITISVNQKPVPEESIRKGFSRPEVVSNSGRDVVDLSIPLTLDSGENKIVVTAYNLQNESEKTEITVKRLEDLPKESGGEIHLVAQADVDQYILGLQPRTPNPQRWAVIIGIEKYRKAPEVRFAERDAYFMREYASRLLDVPADHIVLLVNDQATKNELLGLLEDRLLQEVKPGDTLYVFFAGHGTVAASRDASVGASYLLPSDADPQSPRITGYSLQDFYGDLGKIPAAKVVVFLDACFSGLSARVERPESLVPGTRGSAYMAVPQLELPPNLLSISAASSKQVSNAYNQEAHGLFTYFLLKGFSGEAWKHNRLLLSELANYVRSNVSESAHKLFPESLQQTPTVSPGVSPDHDVVLAEK